MTNFDELFNELFPGEEGELHRYVEANAQRFKVSAIHEVAPDNDFIAVAHEAVNLEGDFTREEAKERVAALERLGTPAYYTPTSQEFKRLWKEWEDR